MQALYSWVAFVLAPPPPLPQFADVTVFQLIGPWDFLAAAAWKTALLAALSLGLPHVFARLFPAMEARTASKAASWVSALVHHTYVVLLSLAALQAQLAAPGEAAIPAMLGGVTWTVAYLLSDTLTTAVPDALAGQYDYLLHHGLAIAMTGLVVGWLPAKLLRLAPHLWLCEVSAFGLGLSWACQKAGLGASLLCRLAEALFMVTFLSTRCLNLPLVVYGAVASGEVQGALTAIMGAIVAQQFWWAGKALAKFVLPEAAKPAEPAAAAAAKPVKGG
jgi:hypothetical protein